VFFFLGKRIAGLMLVFCAGFSRFTVGRGRILFASCNFDEMFSLVVVVVFFCMLLGSGVQFFKSRYIRGDNCGEGESRSIYGICSIFSSPPPNFFLVVIYAL